MLSLSFISYLSVHMQREMWSISKPKIKSNPKFNLTEDNLSIVDTVNFFVYGMTQFVAGAFGDSFPLKYCLPASFTLQACACIALGLGGLNFVNAEALYIACFATLGFT